MDYERIEKPHQGGNAGGFSPGKLRSMLLGGVEKEKEKKRREEEEVDESLSFTSTSTYSSRSQHQRQQQQQHANVDGDSCDNYKDVDVVVSVLPDPECSTSSTADSSLPAQMMISDRRLKDQSAIRSQQEYSLDYDSAHAHAHDGIFDFERQQRHQLPIAPFSKPAPSKWDDAQKWIASPNSNRPRNQVGGGRKVGSVSRQSSTKVVVEVPTDQTVPAPAYEEPDTKRIDTSQAKKFVSWEAKPVLMIENSVAESAINLSRHDSSIAIQSATTFIPPPSTARSVSMRDMGTEMTPIASQEPSRTGTPVRATTPLRSPTSSRPSTPGRTASAPSPTNPSFQLLDLNNDLSEKELQMKTRREIMVLGTQLGKMNIAAWASKEEEDKDASTSLKTVAAEQPTKTVIETRATAWEEAEKAKYMARFKREEMKIQAWENHQKAKTEAEMRKIEVEVERIRGRAQDKLMNKLAAARHKAEGKRAEAEAKRNRQAAKTEQQAEYIRRTGRIPSSFSCWSWCS